ncbi:MAG: expansin EXLX1 family cellulose-binding protein [Lachnospiraceae bacterium]|jgi:expansin (peptidoglycan-binding protein)|nr:expansin EXLX1 family cellulose-binding protein [Lachnospiraceae bacterium]MEE3461906.1 expansin EXLX1 family cellulose-binding protein [Lachnospiraceae bacterium]
MSSDLFTGKLRHFRRSSLFAVICLVIAILVTGIPALPGFSSENEAQAASRVKLSAGKLTLRVGQKKRLKLKGASGPVAWYTGDKKVARVSGKGVITARKKGSCIITAYYRGKRYKCRLTVKKKITAKKTAAPKETVKPKKTEAPEASPSPEPSAALTPTPSATVAPLTVDKDALNKVHTGDGTYYGDNTKNGYNYGNASLNGFFTGDSSDGTVPAMENGQPLYVCALNKADYLSGLQGAYIRITPQTPQAGALSDHVDCLVADQLPEGKEGDVDLDRLAFPQIAPLAVGRLKINWQIIAYPTELPIQYVFKDGSTQYWAQVQVRNLRYPIVSLEYKKSGEPETSYVALHKEAHNYFTMSKAGPGPYDFRATDIFGDVLTDSIPLTAAGTPVSGAANFPKHE